MNWIQTFSGKKFSFNPIDPKQICLVDIAHALSYTCRYGGHCHKFYSVAEHSMLIAGHFLQMGRQDLADQALLHDATEAYIGDMVRPFKELVPQFNDFEQNLAKVIGHKYSVPLYLNPLVKEADTRILLNEKNFLFPPETQLLWGIEETMKPLEGVEVEALPSEKVFPLFLQTLVNRFGQYEIGN